MKNGKIILPIMILLIIIILDFVNIHYMDFKNINSVSALKEALSQVSLSGELINISGMTLKTMDSKLYYIEDGVIVTSDNNTINVYPEVNVDFEVEKMKLLQQELSNAGINLIYVNAPVKYSDDNYAWEECGIRSYANQNADVFISRLREEGIDTVDLRESLFTDNDVTLNSFYKGDHHWKIETGFKVAEQISEELENKGYHDMSFSVLDQEDYFIKDTYNDYFLGEQAEKVSSAYIGKDDISVIYPAFDIEYSYTMNGKQWDGTFNDMFDYYSIYEGGYIRYYMYLGANVNDLAIHNNYLNNGKVAILGDSLTNAVAPFLSVEMEEVQVYNPRVILNEGKSIIDELVNSGCDTVIILYSEAVLGGHENMESANAPMFLFDYY